MSGNGGQHPARSVEFLSRLHDGDLDASERARFEAHRTHCAECRRAAVEFEDAISLFRASRSTPPRADLALRILRKVQSTNRPRSPFSPRFRLDLTWAALLVTALLALLIATPITVRRASPPPASPLPAPPLPAPETGSAPPMDAISSARANDSETFSRDRAAAKGRIASRPAPPLQKKKDGDEGRSDVTAAAAPREKEAKLEDQSAALKAEVRTERDERRDAVARQVAVAESPAFAAGGAEEPPASVAKTLPMRLSYHSIDGYGAAPALVPGAPIELSREERGREYVLLLDSQGAVREVRPSPAPEALSRLHFSPGNRPRRLLVRIE